MSTAVQNIELHGLTDKHFLVVAFETISYLGWRTKFISDAGVIAYTENGNFSWNGEITVKLEAGTANIKCVTISNLPDDYGHCDQTVEQFVTAFKKLENSFTEDEINEKYKLYKKDFLPAYEDTLKPDTRPKFHVFNGALSYVKPTDGYFVTPIIIGLNVLVFLVMVCTGASFFDPGIDTMLSWGANSTVNTLDGEWWRLITSCFIHFGFMHLLLNMYALFYVGFLLEPFLGRSKFLTAYLLTGICGSLASLWWHNYTVSAGASGAIFGMYGIFLAILSTNHIERSMRSGLLASIGVFVVYNLVYGSFKGGTDNAAHIGGLLSGALIGYLYVIGLKKPDNQRLNTILTTSIIVVTLVCCAIGYSLMAKSDNVTYYKRMLEFYNIETKAIDVLKVTENGTDQEIANALYKGNVYWAKNIKLIRELDKLNLSAKLHQKNKILEEYCQIRIKSYQFMMQGAIHHTRVDDIKLQELNEQLKSTLDKLKQD